MRVLLYKEMQNMLKVSGIGRAFRQQFKALEMNGIDVTSDKSHPFDLVHFNTVFEESFSFLKHAKRKGIPVVVHAHSTKEDFLNSFNFSKYIKHWFYAKLKNMYSNADVIITPSNYSKSLLESYGYIKCPIKVLSNGIDLKEYERDEKKVEAFRNHFNLKPSDKVVIGVGLLFERKGLHDFIEVARMMPEITFIWFGTLNKAMQTKVIKQAIENKPSNMIMPGYIAGDVIKGAFSSANCLLFPSYEETEGIVILEAMASRLPIIVRDIPVYAEFTHGKELHKGTSNLEFATRIQQILKKDTSVMTETAYQSVSQKDLILIGQQLKAIYEETIERVKNHDNN